MKITTKLIIKPEIHNFDSPYYDLKDNRIILQSIKLCSLTKDNFIKQKVCFDIQCIGENWFRIIPKSDENKFSIQYNRVINCKELKIDEELLDFFKTDDGKYTFLFSDDGTTLTRGENK